MKNGTKNIQTAGNNGSCMVHHMDKILFANHYKTAKQQAKKAIKSRCIKLVAYSQIKYNFMN